MEVNKKEYLEFLEWKKQQIKIWKPKNGEKCWILSSYIGVLGGFEIVYDDIEHSGYYDAGLIKQTQEEIEFLIQKSKVTKELQDFAEEHNKAIDWEDFEQSKWYIIYNFFYKRICCDIDVAKTKHNDIHFSSEKLCKQAIKTIGEERIKKYYFEIKENK